MNKKIGKERIKEARKIYTIYPQLLYEATTTQLNQYIKQHENYFPNYVTKTIPNDKLQQLWPQIYNINFILIINQQIHVKPGNHWILLFQNKNKNIMVYFDSFGNESLMRNNVKKLLPSHCLKNVERLQSSFSTICGYYCLYFAHQLFKDIPFQKIINKFDFYNYLKNDLFIMENFDFE